MKVIDFIESDCEDCFKVWGIHLDGKLPELDLSDDVKKQKLNYAEPLPKAELKDGKSVITGRLTMRSTMHFRFLVGFVIC